MDERDHAVSNVDVATHIRRFLSGGNLWVLDVWVHQANTWRVAAVQTTTAKK